MDPNQLRVDSVELGMTANKLRADHGPVEASGEALKDVQFVAWPGDPLYTGHLPEAVQAFVTTWGNEVAILAQGIEGTATDLDYTSKTMLDTAQRIAEDTINASRPWAK